MTKKATGLDDFLTNETQDQPPVKDTTPIPAPTPPAPQFKKRFKREMPDTSGLIISPKLIPPITRRRMAIYQLLTASETRFDSRVISTQSGDRIVANGPTRIEPAPFELHPIYELYDPYEPVLAKRRKRMVYSNDIAVQEYYNTNVTNADVSTNTRIEMPQFIGGQVTVDVVGSFNKYIWFELHPKNLSNKHRDKNVVANFKRIDIEFQSPHAQLMRRDLAIDAERHIIGLNTEQLINLAAAFGIPTNTKPGDMRLEMRRRAADNPREVLFKSPDNKATAMMNIMSAIDLGILDFDPDSQNYYLGEDRNPVWTCLVDQSPLEDFAKFLITPEGREAKEEIESLLNFWV